MKQMQKKFSMPLAWLMIISAVGCDQGARSLSLDVEQARIACTTFLTAWQNDKQADSLKPDIIGRDYAWDEGSKLVSFELLSEEFNDGTNLHIPVRLKMQDAKGSESESEVVYVVGTSPVVTVFRED